MALFLYNIFIRVYVLGIRIASIKSNKAALWLSGRKNIFNELQNWRKQITGNEKLIWFHCASLGEFEQARPIIESIKEQYPAYKILLTFFSPSGYEIRKNYDKVDAVFYLPMDNKRNAIRFINIANPTLVIWVKYEYWYYFLTTLRQRNIPVLLVSAIFRESQPFFKWYGSLWKKILHSFSHVFVQNEHSIELLKLIKLDSNSTLSGDTRFDRVITIAEKGNQLPASLFNFCEGNKIIVAGSTWEEDEEEIVHYTKIHKDIKLIIAPHEIDEERIVEMRKLFKDAILYSDFIVNNKDAQIIIIDNIGLLSTLYQLADVVYIGGGFNHSGIHNILEAAVYGKPIIFGPVYEKFSEALDLVNKGAAFSIENAVELECLLDKLFNDENLRAEASKISKSYVYKKRGATKIILEYFQEKRLLIN